MVQNSMQISRMQTPLATRSKKQAELPGVIAFILYAMTESLSNSFLRYLIYFLLSLLIS